MISGAVPVVWQREGATEVFGSSFVHEDTDTAATFILNNSTEPKYDRLRELASQQSSRYEVMEARNQWMQLIFSEDEIRPIELSARMEPVRNNSGLSDPPRTTEQ